MANRSLTVFETELSELKQKAAPLEWASARTNLGYSLVVLGQEKADIDILKRTIEDIEDALQGCNPEESLQEWVALQNDYATSLHALGQLDTGATVSILNEAMEAYKSLLPLLKRQENPLKWALVLHNIAMVFQDLGAHSKGSRTLERSISAFNNALTERTSDIAPLEWAVTQNNAAVSMQILGEIQQDADILKESILSYSNALTKLTQEKNPLAWVISTGNLSSVCTILAEQIKDIDIARQAVNNFTDIVEFFRDASDARHIELAEQYRDKAQAVLLKIDG